MTDLRRENYQDMPLFNSPTAPAPEPAPCAPELPDPEHFPTLVDAQASMVQEMRDGTDCPCCGQVVKLYKRKLNSAMARSLILFYNKSRGAEDGWIHLLNTFKNTGFFTGDYVIPIHWKMLEKMPERAEDGNPSKGMYRLTDRGKRFVLGQEEIPRSVYIYGDQCLGFDGPMVKIRECLGDKFNYDELMGS